MAAYIYRKDNNMSDTDPKAIQAFAAALSAFQGSVEQIRKDKTAKAGSYSYDYADLGGIIATVRKELAANGLSVMQALGTADDGRPAITTILLHKGGHSERSTFAFPGQPDMQQLGSSDAWVRTRGGRRRWCVCLAAAAGAGREEGPSKEPSEWVDHRAADQSIVRIRHRCGS